MFKDIEVPSPSKASGKLPFVWYPLEVKFVVFSTCIDEKRYSNIFSKILFYLSFYYSKAYSSGYL